LLPVISYWCRLWGAPRGLPRSISAAAGGATFDEAVADAMTT
jgi:hypothetical protein